jgi:hypothetical protein
MLDHEARAGHQQSVLQDTQNRCLRGVLDLMHIRYLNEALDAREN